MMKNRAGWLALIVLAVASLLMVFFVMPRINQGSKPLGEAINAAGDAVKDAMKEGQQTAATPAPANPAPAIPAPAGSVTTASPGATMPGTTTPAPAIPAPANTALANPALALAQPNATQPSATETSPAQPAAQDPQAARPAAPQPASQAAAAAPSFDVLRVEPDGSTVIAGRAQPHSTLEVTDGTSVVAKVDVGPSGDFAAVLDTPLPPGDHQLVLKATGKDGKSSVSQETATISVPANQKSGKLLAMVTTPGKASRLIATPSPATNTAAATASAAAQTGAPVQAAPLASAPAASGETASAAPNAAPPSPTVATSSAAATPAAELQITAVEIEGSKIFVAGIAKTATTVRGLADGKTIGQARTGSDGHFVIEGTVDLNVGDHRISVESLSGTGQALVRVDVPFNRPAGEQVAAVAAPATAASPTAASPVAAPIVSTPMAAVDGGGFDKLRNETVRAFNILKRIYAGGKTPPLEEVAAARSATSIALKSLSQYRLPAEASASARMLSETTTRDAGTAVAALDALAPDVASVGAALQEIGRLVARAVGPVIAQQIEGTEIAAAEPAPAADASGARTIQQAPLTQSDRGAVIIRRGDTLWQISRRVYGQGVRYTTIYLANEDQIPNPDVIQPGQIFGVPEEFRPDAEQLHRQRVHPRKG